MNPLFTIKEMRLLSGADPDELPTIMAHTSGWPDGKVFMDSKNRLHMSAGEVLALKEYIPVALIGMRAGVTHFKMVLEGHHLVGDRFSVRPAETAETRKGVLRDITGQSDEAWHE